MRYLSLFSGIEAAAVATAPLGWTCVAVAEVDKAASRQLAKHYPHIPNLGDVTKITAEQIAALGPVDVVIFGSPCQDLSQAGKRRGLAGARSGLFIHAVEILGWAREFCGARFGLWENVPGAFTSNKGRDFARVVGLLAGCADPDVPKNGWGTEGCALGDLGMVEWSVLDAQWFGLAQRRKRVFALVDFGAWADRPPILLERESVRGNSPPRRGPGQGVAGALDARVAGGGFPGTDGACAGHVVPAGGQFGPDLAVVGALTAAHGPNGHGGPIDVATARNAAGSPHGRLDFESETFVAEPAVAFALRGREGGAQLEVTGDHASALRAASGGSTRDYVAVVVPIQETGKRTGESTSNTRYGSGIGAPGDPMFTLGTDSRHGVATAYEVRRLTPVECERLQGFPDGYSAGQADGPRYKQLGNSFAVPVIRWIAESIMVAVMAS